MKSKYDSHKLALSISASILSACGAGAFEVPLAHFSSNLPPIDLHGFISQGYIYNTGDNNYLGGKSSEGTFDFREYGMNASIAYDKWRVGAQFFGQKLGPYGGDKMTLDWANVDYHASQWFGLRAGRVKSPRGLYNEVLDLDSTRPFILMPQSVYDARLRDFNSSFDGGMAYGNVELGKAGSLDYSVYGGAIPMSLQSGASDYFNTGLNAENLAIGMDDVVGASLFYNTPISGLRVGYSASMFQNLQSLRRITFGPTTYTYTKSADYYRQLISAEYSYGKWLFAAEGGYDYANYCLIGFGPKNFRPADLWYGYVSATRRMNSWLELGAYYSYSSDKQGPTDPLIQNDFDLSAKFDISQNLIFKLEAHYINGSGKLFSTASQPQPVETRDNSWVLMAAKVTFSF